MEEKEKNGTKKSTPPSIKKKDKANTNISLIVFKRKRTLNIRDNHLILPENLMVFLVMFGGI